MERSTVGHERARHPRPAGVDAGAQHRCAESQAPTAHADPHCPAAVLRRQGPLAEPFRPPAPQHILDADLAADSDALAAPQRPGLAGKAHAPWSEVCLLAGLSMFGSVAMDMYLPALPRMGADLHAGHQAAQATISVFLLGLALGQLVFGPLSDRFGRRPSILGGVAVYVVASGLCAFAGRIEVLVAARLAQALGACAGSVVARAVVRDRYEDHEVLHVYSLLSLVFGVAPVLAPLLGGWVLGLASWRWIFAVQALFGVAAAAAAFLRLPESRSVATQARAKSERPWTAYAALLRTPVFTGYLLTGGFSGAALFAYITAAPRLIISELHVPPAHFGWVFGINAVGLIMGGQVNARLARRIPGNTLLQGALTVALAASGVLLACAATGSGGAWGVLVPLFGVIASLGFSQPNATAAAMSVDRQRAGASAALLGAGFFGVGSLAGALAGLIPGSAARGMALVIAASLVLALLAYRLLVAPSRREAAG